MTYDPASDTSLKRAIARLLRAEEAHIFLGTVPVYSDDREEQEAITAYRGKALGERKRAEACLLRLIGRRVNKGGK